MGIVNYPGQLEHFWREEARRLWGFLPETELLERIRPHVQALSDRFTVERARAPEPYGDDPAARVAYGMFFFPQTFARTQFVLRECGWPPPGENSQRVLDLGAGTGAAGFAALHTLGGRHARLRAVDRSAGALETLGRAAAACRELWPGAEFETIVSDLSDKADLSDKQDLILCSFALNELAEREPAFDASAWVRGLVSRLSPGGLLVVIEPALKLCAERLEAVRDRIAAEGRLRIVGPCPHHAPCPMRAEGRFWCHEVRRWSPPPLAEKINRTLFRDLPHVKFSFLALRREPIAEAAWARLVAPVAEERGKFVTRACCAEGTLRTLELLSRGLDAEGRAALRRMERGTRVAFVPDRELASGATRIRRLSEMQEISLPS